MKKNGFIATSLIYSFFLLFCAILVCYVGVFMHNKLLLNNLTDEIKEELSSGSKKLYDAKIGSYVKLNMDDSVFSTINDTNKWIVLKVLKNADNNYDVYLISDSIIYNTVDKNSAIDNNGYISYIKELDSSFSIADGGKYIVSKEDLFSICDYNYSDYVYRSIFAGSILSSNDESGVKYSFLVKKSDTDYSFYVIPSNDFSNSDIKNLYCSESNLVDDESSLLGYNVRIVIKLSSYNDILTGNGTVSDPYVLKEA